MNLVAEINNFQMVVRKNKKLVVKRNIIAGQKEYCNLVLKRTRIGGQKELIWW